MSTETKKKADAAAAAAAAGGESAPSGRRKKLLVLVLGVLVISGAAAWFLLFRGGEAVAEPEPVPGDVVALEAISVNLADGHYLRIGIALQVVEGAAEAPEGSKALDLTIATFSGRTTAELTDAAVRDALKAELTERVGEAYHDEVMDVYFTEFVTQ